MEGILRGRKCRVEIGYTEGAAKVVSAVTAAAPPEATSTAHGLANGSVGYFNDVEGMTALGGQVARVAATDTNDFQAEGLDMTDQDAYVSGEFVPVTAWRTLAQATEYQIGGGSLVTEDNTVLLDDREQLEPIMLAAETVSISAKALDEDNEALAKLRTLARSLTPVVFRITTERGAQRLFRGACSLPGENLAVKGTGTGSFQVQPIGAVLFLPKAA